MASKLDLTVNRIPDGTYMAVLDKADGTRVTRENVTFSAGSASINFASVNVGETIKGYIDDGQNIVTRAAYLEGVSVAPASLLTVIQDRLLAGYSAGSGYNYIVAGDSTRDRANSVCLEYYTQQLGKIKWSVTDNSKSGQSGAEWANNTYSPSNGVQAAIDATPNTGKNTILEYSFGINDVSNSVAASEAIIEAGLDAYMQAKPDAIVLLATPSPTADAARATRLNSAYSNIAASRALMTVDVHDAMLAIQSDNDFYIDTSHPSDNGSMRFINYITSEIMHPTLYQYVTMRTPTIESPVVGNMAKPIESNFWSTSNGSEQTFPTNWRKMQEIAVEPNFEIKVTHGGNKSHAIFMDQSGAFVSFLTFTSGTAFTIPVGVYALRINVSDDGTNYDALNDTPEVEYHIPEITTLAQTAINTGLTLNLPY